MGVCVSNDIPGFLEIGHFWYPAEYTDEIISIGWSQVYVPMFSMRPGSELADMIDRIYFDKRNHDCCTFPFNLDLVVKLEGYFMDDLNKSAKIIRDELRNAGPQEQKNGEFLISIMNDLMEA